MTTPSTDAIDPRFHPALLAYLTTHKSQVADHKRQVHDALIAVNQIATKVRMLVAQMQGELHEAELAAHNSAQNTKLNFMHTRLRGAEAAASTLYGSARTLSQVLEELDAGFSLDTQGLARVLDIHGTESPATPST
jgi:ABC-type transporter Mla subunit MlaD